MQSGRRRIIPAPYWVSYAELVKLTGAVPVIVPTQEANNFKLTPEEVPKAITPKTTILLICSPSNPTGTMYSPEELGALADIVLEANLTVVSDEIYERLIYGNHRFASLATVRPGMQERTIVVNGASKAYAMTGWRIGWTLSPANVATAMADLQSQETSNPSSISQYAAIAAIEGPQQCVEQMLVEFSKRARVRAAAHRLDPRPVVSRHGRRVSMPSSTSRATWAATTAARVDNSTQWCLTLLEQQNVATVMGSAFGAEGYARISFRHRLGNAPVGLRSHRGVSEEQVAIRAPRLRPSVTLPLGRSAGLHGDSQGV